MEDQPEWWKREFISNMLLYTAFMPLVLLPGKKADRDELRKFLERRLNSFFTYNQPPYTTIRDWSDYGWEYVSGRRPIIIQYGKKEPEHTPAPDGAGLKQLTKALKYGHCSIDNRVYVEDLVRRLRLPFGHNSDSPGLPRMTPRDQTTIEVEQMFAGLEGRSLEGEGNAPDAYLETNWQEGNEHTETSYQEYNDRIGIRRYQGRPHGGLRPGAGRPPKPK